MKMTKELDDALGRLKLAVRSVRRAVKKLAVALYSAAERMRELARRIHENNAVDERQRRDNEWPREMCQASEACNCKNAARNNSDEQRNNAGGRWGLAVPTSS